jgi:hypothetical protein
MEKAYAGSIQTDLPLEPDYDRYFELERNDVMRCFGARVDGRLVGAAGFTCVPHIQSKGLLCADCHLIFVDDEYRPLVGLPMMRAVDRELTRLQIPVRMFSAPLDRRLKVTLGDVLKRLGYKAVEVRYCKVVPDE